MPYQLYPTVNRPVPRNLNEQTRDAQIRLITERVNQLSATPNPVDIYNNLMGFITNQSVWFNVVGVILGVILIVLALNVILRKTA